MDRLRLFMTPLALAAVGCSSTDEVLQYARLPDGYSMSRGQAPEPPAVVRIQSPAPPPGSTTGPAEPAAPSGIVQTQATDTVTAGSGPSPQDATTQIRVVAVVGPDVVITDDEVWQMVRQRAREYVTLTGTARDAAEKQYFREELRKLIERELIIADFVGKVKKNKPQVLEEVRGEADRAADKQLREFRRGNGIHSEAQYQEALKHQGLTEKGIRRQLERGALMNMYLGQLLKERSKPASLAEITRYYEDHPDEFHLDDKVKWLDLFVSYRRFNTDAEAKQYAEQLYQQAVAGADFVPLVKKYGHGDSVLRDGEGIGIKPGEIQPRELEPTLLKMTSGQVSRPIPTENGIHILKVIERDQAGVRPFDTKTQAAIRERIMSLGRKGEYDRLIDELWRKTTVQVIGLP